MKPSQVPDVSNSLPSPGLPRQLLYIKADGLMFLGDPHLTGVRPGRRLEDDFLPVPLKKIEHARRIAEEKNLFMVFLGDLCDLADGRRQGNDKLAEDTNPILAGFAHAMNFRPCVTIPGNHDKHETTLTTGTTLATMRDLRLVNVIEPGGAYAIFDIQGFKVGLGGTPYGEPIPKDVRDAFPERVDRVVWLTHSQFEFDIKNPFLDKVFEIRGCDMVVNGHDHTTMKPQCVGQTWWHNPGNITRMSVNCKDHVPSAWEWNPLMAAGEMVQHVLPHNKLAFDLRGYQVQSDVEAAHQQEQVRAKSLFAELLAVDTPADLQRSANGDVIAADVQRYIEAHPSMTPAAQLILQNLLRRAPDRLAP